MSDYVVENGATFMEFAGICLNIRKYIPLRRTENWLVAGEQF